MNKLTIRFSILSVILYSLLFSALCAESEANKKEDKYWESHRLRLEQEQKDYDQRQLDQRYWNDQIEKRRLERQREERARH